MMRNLQFAALTAPLLLGSAYAAPRQPISDRKAAAVAPALVKRNHDPCGPTTYTVIIPKPGAKPTPVTKQFQPVHSCIPEYVVCDSKNKEKCKTVYKTTSYQWLSTEVPVYNGIATITGVNQAVTIAAQPTNRIETCRCEEAGTCYYGTTSTYVAQPTQFPYVNTGWNYHVCNYTDYYKWYSGDYSPDFSGEKTHGGIASYAPGPQGPGSYIGGGKGNSGPVYNPQKNGHPQYNGPVYPQKNGHPGSYNGKINGYASGPSNYNGYISGHPNGQPSYKPKYHGENKPSYYGDAKPQSQGNGDYEMVIPESNGYHGAQGGSGYDHTGKAGLITSYQDKADSYKGWWPKGGNGKGWWSKSGYEGEKTASNAYVPDSYPQGRYPDGGAEWNGEYDMENWGKASAHGGNVAWGHNWKSLQVECKSCMNGVCNTYPVGYISKTIIKTHTYRVPYHINSYFPHKTTFCVSNLGITLTFYGPTSVSTVVIGTSTVTSVVTTTETTTATVTRTETKTVSTQSTVTGPTVTAVPVGDYVFYLGTDLQPTDPTDFTRSLVPPQTEAGTTIEGYVVCSNNVCSVRPTCRGAQAFRINPSQQLTNSARSVMAFANNGDIETGYALFRLGTGDITRAFSFSGTDLVWTVASAGENRVATYCKNADNTITVVFDGANPEGCESMRVFKVDPFEPDCLGETSTSSMSATSTSMSSAGSSSSGGPSSAATTSPSSAATGSSSAVPTGSSSAGPSSAAPSSAGPSSAGPSSAGPSSAAPSSAGPSSAGPSSGAPSSTGPSTAASSSAGPSSAGPSSAGPSSAGPSSAGPSSAGPSSAGPSSAGPSSAGPSSAGSSSAGPSSAGPSSAGPSSAGPSSAGPSSAAPSSAGPSSAGPSSAGPSSAAPSSAAPSSAAPSSAGPSSGAPSTAGPSSAGPSLAAPTTGPPTAVPTTSEAPAITSVPANIQLGTQFCDTLEGLNLDGTCKNVGDIDPCAIKSLITSEALEECKKSGRKVPTNLIGCITDTGTADLDCILSCNKDFDTVLLAQQCLKKSGTVQDPSIRCAEMGLSGSSDLLYRACVALQGGAPCSPQFIKDQVLEDATRYLTECAAAGLLSGGVKTCVDTARLGIDVGSGVNAGIDVLSNVAGLNLGGIGGIGGGGAKNPLDLTDSLNNCVSELLAGTLSF